MGAVFEFNWLLKLTNDQIQELSEGSVYPFKKKEMRIYPIGIPIDLVNENWEAVARCIILSINIQNNCTNGTYKILKVYGATEKDIFTKSWRETLCYSIKEYDIDDYSEKHIT